MNFFGRRGVPRVLVARIHGDLSPHTIVHRLSVEERAAIALGANIVLCVPPLEQPKGRKSSPYSIELTIPVVAIGVEGCIPEVPEYMPVRRR